MDRLFTLPRVPLSDLVWTFLGAFAAMGFLGLAAQQVATWPGVGPWHTHGLNLLIGSFGTISVLLFAKPEAEVIKVWMMSVDGPGDGTLDVGSTPSF